MEIQRTKCLNSHSTRQKELCFAGNCYWSIASALTKSIAALLFCREYFWYMMERRFLVRIAFSRPWYKHENCHPFSGWILLPFKRNQIMVRRKMRLGEFYENFDEWVLKDRLPRALYYLWRRFEYADAIFFIRYFSRYKTILIKVEIWKEKFIPRCVSTRQS